MNTAELWQQILAAPNDDGPKARYIHALSQTDARCAMLLGLWDQSQPYSLQPYHFDHYLLGLTEQNPEFAIPLENWRADFERLAKSCSAQIRYIKGWPILMTIKTCDFVRCAAEITATIPLCHLNLEAVSEAPEAFGLPQFGQIISLSAGSQAWSAEAASALAVSAQVRSLRWLDVPFAALTDAQIEILAASPNLRELEYVNLAGNPCRDVRDSDTAASPDWGTGAFLGHFFLPEFGKELEDRYGAIKWLHPMVRFADADNYPPSRYQFALPAAKPPLLL